VVAAVSRLPSWSSPASPCPPLSVNGVTGRLDEGSALVGSQTGGRRLERLDQCASAMTYGMTSLPSGTKHPLTMKGAIAPWTFNAVTGSIWGASF